MMSRGSGCPGGDGGRGEGSCSKQTNKMMERYAGGERDLRDTKTKMSAMGAFGEKRIGGKDHRKGKLEIDRMRQSEEKRRNPRGKTRGEGKNFFSINGREIQCLDRTTCW